MIQFRAAGLAAGAAMAALAGPSWAQSEEAGAERDSTLVVDISQVERRMTQADSERTCDGVRIRALITSSAWTDER